MATPFAYLMTLAADYFALALLCQDIMTVDETDMEILRLLSQDARRSYTDIAEKVEMSLPAVSDRIERLEDSGIINGFSVDINRIELEGGAKIFVQLDPGKSVDSIRSRLDESDAVEHVMVTADGELWFNAHAELHNVHSWLRTLVEPAETAEYSVTLMDEVEWQPALTGTGLSMSSPDHPNTSESGRS